MKMAGAFAVLIFLCGISVAACDCSAEVDFQFRTIDRLSELEQRMNKLSLEQSILTRKLSEKLSGCEETEEGVLIEDKGHAVCDQAYMVSEEVQSCVMGFSTYIGEAMGPGSDSSAAAGQMITVLCSEKGRKAIGCLYTIIERCPDLQNTIGAGMPNKTSLEVACNVLNPNSNPSEPTEHCKDGWTRFKGSCYLFGDTDKTALRAQIFCEGFNASLVQIETREENEFLQRMLRARKSPRHWIGITDEVDEGTWIPLDGVSDVRFLDWGKHQPNNGEVSNCAAFWESFGYKWVDEPCTNKFKAICEM